MTETIDPAALISRPPGVVASEIDGEVVVLDVATGRFFQLNAIGSHIWAALQTPASLAALIAAMQAEFDVDADECHADVTDFVTRLSGSGLLTVAG